MANRERKKEMFSLALFFFFGFSDCSGVLSFGSLLEEMAYRVVD